MQLRIWTAVLVSLLGVPVASAQEKDSLVGREVVVVEWNTPVMTGTETVDQVQVGDRLKVSKVNGPWLWIEGRRGWVRTEKVLPVEQAVSHFDQAIRKSPTAEAYRDRGIVRASLGDVQAGLADLEEAIRRGLKQPGLFLSRGRMRADLKQLDEALADYNEAIRLDPNFAPAYQLRGLIWQRQGEYEKALADFAKAVSLEPRFALAWNNLAWLQATCAEMRFRDGKQAVEAARKACELTNNRDPRFLDTLAAALAEAGEFDAAVEQAELALKTLPEKEQAAAKERLELYRQRKPFHEREELK